MHVQVKYCFSEEELNNFLKTLHVAGDLLPRLHTIQYMANVRGDVQEDKGSISNSVIAMVQYFIEGE